MELFEGLLHLIALLIRSIVLLFELIDLLQVLHSIVSFVAELLNQALASMPWYRQKQAQVVAPLVARAKRRRVTGPVVQPRKS